MNFRRTVLGATVLALLPLFVTGPGAASPTVQPKRLAGQTWHYRAQVDGRKGKDRVTITALKGSKLDAYGMGSGQFKVHVDFDGGGFAEIWTYLTYLSVRSPWTPWLGATDLDHRPGKELVIGISTGAHAQLFAAYAYRPDGELVELQSPLGGEWMVDSSVGTGSSGWRCTKHGVEVLAVSPPSGQSVQVKQDSYALRRSGWVRTHHNTATEPLDAAGNPPADTATYPRFDCPGLPTDVL